jgi:hypothetical protein
MKRAVAAVFAVGVLAGCSSAPERAGSYTWTDQDRVRLGVGDDLGWRLHQNDRSIAQARARDARESTGLASHGD